MIFWVIQQIPEQKAENYDAAYDDDSMSDADDDKTYSEDGEAPSPPSPSTPTRTPPPLRSIHRRVLLMLPLWRGFNEI
jgi:hypothetical protein